MLDVFVDDLKPIVLAPFPHRIIRAVDDIRIVERAKRDRDQLGEIASAIIARSIRTPGRSCRWSSGRYSPCGSIPSTHLRLRRIRRASAPVPRTRSRCASGTRGNDRPRPGPGHRERRRAVDRNGTRRCGWSLRRLLQRQPDERVERRVGAELVLRGVDGGAGFGRLEAEVGERGQSVRGGAAAGRGRARRRGRLTPSLP